jgi:hypothetical protein
MTTLANAVAGVLVTADVGPSNFGKKIEYPQFVAA